MKKYRIKPIMPRAAELMKTMKHNPLKSLSLGVLILGIGCILVFISGMLSPSGDAEYTELAAYSKEVVPEQAKQVVYDINPAEGDLLGTLEIPALERKIDIFQGTGAKELSMGVGHFVQSVLPGIKDNCVLSGHNDSVFTKLDSLEMGDLLIVRTKTGEFTYKVNGKRVVDKYDKTVIVPTEEATLTLTTCYPFIGIGPAPERYIISALLIND